jgi:hypothetical protein
MSFSNTHPGKGEPIFFCNEPQSLMLQRKPFRSNLGEWTDVWITVCIRCAKCVMSKMQVSSITNQAWITQRSVQPTTHRITHNNLDGFSKHISQDGGQMDFQDLKHNLWTRKHQVQSNPWVFPLGLPCKNPRKGGLNFFLIYILKLFFWYYWFAPNGLCVPLLCTLYDKIIGTYISYMNLKKLFLNCS